jgi:hypothetical protein
MDPQSAAYKNDHRTAVELAVLEEHIRCQLAGRVRDLNLMVTDQGLVLRGHAHTYYAKQLAQQAVLAASSTPIVANEIDVS